MEQILYERPREKLRGKGAVALSMAELIQVVLGSGSSQASGAKIARQVVQMLSEDTVSYRSLTALPGIGDAKACQILAVLEVARRV